uniref:histidine kinase n=1 Tax=Geobacter metallireducens TaxID=28232 RepID=A0A831UCP5_GEOME
MAGNGLKIASLVVGVALSLALLLFAVGNYRSSIPIAEGQLRGLALSLSAAIESMAARDPSFSSLSTFRARDVAYFSLIDSAGTQHFHSNPALIGTRVEDDRYRGIFGNAGIVEAKVRLGTGEEVYEFNSPLHLSSRTLALRLVLHAYRADAVVRRARIGMVVILSLLVTAWTMAGLLYRYGRREQRHREEMARRERLAHLGEMGAVIAHEVRNPLSGIKGYAQLLQERVTDGEARGFAGLIVAESIRLERLVNDLLLYSRQGPREMVQLDLADTLIRCRALVAPEAEKSGVVIEQMLQGPLPVRGNGELFQQLFLNLMMNGIQAMPQGGRLTVTAGRGPGVIEVSIADTGPGIPPAERERIFDPFYTTRARGSGLGLAICRKIVEEAGGTIEVTGETGRGATFNVTLPPAEERRI